MFVSSPQQRPWHIEVVHPRVMVAEWMLLGKGWRGANIPKEQQKGLIYHKNYIKIDFLEKNKTLQFCIRHKGHLIL
jgi:hypothetical protein